MPFDRRVTRFGKSKNGKTKQSDTLHHKRVVGLLVFPLNGLVSTDNLSQVGQIYAFTFLVRLNSRRWCRQTRRMRAYQDEPLREKVNLHRISVEFGTPKNQIGVVKVPAVFRHIADFQLFQSGQIFQFKVTRVVTETVLSDVNTAQKRAIQDVERSRRIISVSFLFGCEAVLPNDQRFQIRQALNPEFLHIFERIVSNADGLQVDESPKVEGG